MQWCGELWTDRAPDFPLRGATLRVNSQQEIKTNFTMSVAITSFYQRDSGRKKGIEREAGEREETHHSVSDVPFKRMRYDPKGRVYTGTLSEVVLCF